MQTTGPLSQNWEFLSRRVQSVMFFISFHELVDFLRVKALSRVKGGTNEESISYHTRMTTLQTPKPNVFYVSMTEDISQDPYKRFSYR